MSGAPRPDPEAWLEALLQAVEGVPPGRVTTYGDLAVHLAATVGPWGGPRQVGTALARHGAGVPWWRVVRADGRPARGHEVEAVRRLAAEGTPLRGPRVDLASAEHDLPARAPEDLDADRAPDARHAAPPRHAGGVHNVA